MVLVDGERFKGDDTIGAYSGEFREFLVYLQQTLRVFILCEDAFPKSIDFEKAIKGTFEDKVREALETKGKNKLEFHDVREARTY